MSSPLRAWFLRHVEAPILLKLSGGLRGLHVLELGCGPGASTELLLSLFEAERVVAVDLDPMMVRRARRRVRSEKVSFHVGDAARLEFWSGSFDAVVDFAALHHLVRWRAAIAEVCRVLKPGGRLLFEEVTRQWLERWPYRSLFAHPREDRFSADDFVDELERSLIVARCVEKAGGDFIFGIAAKVCFPNGLERKR